MASRGTPGHPALAAVVSVLVLLLGLCCDSGLAQNGKNEVWYLYPPEGGLALFSLDTVNVSYISPFESPNMFTFCDGGKKLMRVDPAGPRNGSVLVELNFTSSTPCYFNLRPGREAGFSANSPSFNLSSTPRSFRTTVGADLPPNSTPAPEPSSPSDPGSPSATSGAPTGANGNEGSDPGAAGSGGATESLSAGAKAGIGIGAAIAGIGLLTAAFIFGRRCWRRGAAPAAGVVAHINDPKDPDAFGEGGGPYSNSPLGEKLPHGETAVTPSEMSALSPPVEMPSYPLPPVELPASAGHR